MFLFTRAFIRRRMMALATTASFSATSFALAQDPAGTRHVHGGLQYVADRQEQLHEQSEEQPFLSENATAMHKMMADMTIKPTGDVDRDFVEMMVPHHQGAVDMAKAELNSAVGQPSRRWLVDRATHRHHGHAGCRAEIVRGSPGQPQPPL